MTQSGDQWFYGQQGAQRGPVDFDTLRNLFASGQLQQGDLVWRHGMASWSPAASVPGLLPERPAGGPPPIPPTSQPYIPNYAHTVSKPIGDEPGMRMLLPVGRSGWAIAAGYLGLFAVLMLPAPVALIVGIIALIHLKRRPDLHGAGRAWFGVLSGMLFTLLFLLMIVATISHR